MVYTLTDKMDMNLQVLLEYGNENKSLQSHHFSFSVARYLLSSTSEFYVLLCDLYVILLTIIGFQPMQLIYAGYSCTQGWFCTPCTASPQLR
jgi:hypothetical protein